VCQRSQTSHAPTPNTMLVQTGMIRIDTMRPFPVTGGSANGLSATDAWGRAAAGDGSHYTPRHRFMMSFDVSKRLNLGLALSKAVGVAVFER
jgi:hypothetical protein